MNEKTPQAAEPTAIDISADLPQQTFMLAMKRPGTDEPNGWVITLAGPAHPKTIAYRDRAQRERLEKEASIEATQVNGRKYKPDVRTPAEDNERTLNWLVSRIVDWTSIKIGSETIHFTDENARSLFARPYMAPYIAQIVEYLQGERAFMPPSAKN